MLGLIGPNRTDLAYLREHNNLTAILILRAHTLAIRSACFTKNLASVILTLVSISLVFHVLVRVLSRLVYASGRLACSDCNPHRGSPKGMQRYRCSYTFVLWLPGGPKNCLSCRC
jgi:hypothetical protein